MPRKIHYRRFVPGLIGVAVVASVGAGLVYMISTFMDAEPPKVKKTVQNITLLKPPPPPPKLEEQPPEPEIEEEEEVEVPEPEQMEELPDVASDEPMAGDDLGLDADGGAGGDAFGLIGRKGGRGLLAGGMFGSYAGKLRKGIEDVLHQDDTIRSRRYSVVIKMWVDDSGTIERVSLGRSTGEPEVDEAIVAALTGANLDEPPPLEMPMPVKLRITARL
jgi:protein TonB